MSKLSFIKYQGAGNDFILIDDRAPFFDPACVPSLCHRHYGIGADGVILLQHHPTADFLMRIFNSDGTEAESCGNGLRCLAAFLLHLGLPKQSYHIAIGTGQVEVGFEGEQIFVQLPLPHNVKRLYIDPHLIHSLDTGVPHAVIFVPDVHTIDLAVQGALLRRHPFWEPAGTNVNFAALQADGSICVRTYERGVEAESLACGTGAAAVGFIASQLHCAPNPMRLHFPGGLITVHVSDQGIRLLGDAFAVFEGTVKHSLTSDLPAY